MENLELLSQRVIKCNNCGKQLLAGTEIEGVDGPICHTCATQGENVDDLKSTNILDEIIAKMVDKKLEKWDETFQQKLAIFEGQLTHIINNLRIIPNELQGVKEELKTLKPPPPPMLPFLGLSEKELLEAKAKIATKMYLQDFGSLKEVEKGILFFGEAKREQEWFSNSSSYQNEGYIFLLIKALRIYECKGFLECSAATYETRQNFKIAPGEEYIIFPKALIIDRNGNITIGIDKGIGSFKYAAIGSKLSMP